MSGQTKLINPGGYSAKIKNKLCFGLLMKSRSNKVYQSETVPKQKKLCITYVLCKTSSSSVDASCSFFPMILSSSSCTCLTLT
jgi:hypothetical protein